jgi:hypothetical protein
MCRVFALLALALLSCGSSSAQSVRQDAFVEARAKAFASDAQRQFSAGRTEQGMTLATRALLVRLAHFGPERPEPARSFVQLGDLRWRLGQRGWAEQWYTRALEITVPHAGTHPSLVRLAATRLAAARRARGDTEAARRLLERWAR